MTAPMGGAGVGVRGRVGVGVGATVNVQVASWSATATAFPAWSAESKTTCGQSNVAPADAGRHVADDAESLEAGVRARGRSAAASGPCRPAAARTASGCRTAGRAPAGPALAGTPLTSCLPSVKQDHAPAGSNRPAGAWPPAPWPRRSSCRGRSSSSAAPSALPIGGGDRAEAVGELADRCRAVERLQVDAARVVGGFGGELDDRHAWRRRRRGRLTSRRRASAIRSSAAREAVPVGRVLEDRRREVEDEDDLGRVRLAGRAHAAQQAAAGEQQGPTMMIAMIAIARRRRYIYPSVSCEIGCGPDGTHTVRPAASPHNRAVVLAMSPPKRRCLRRHFQTVARREVLDPVHRNPRPVIRADDFHEFVREFARRRQPADVLEERFDPAA